jgi:hypothetical protein
VVMPRRIPTETPPRRRVIGPLPRPDAGGRMFGTLVDQGLSALANFTCVVLVARASAVSVFSVFALQQVLVLTAQWALQSGFNERVLRSRTDQALPLLRGTRRAQRPVAVGLAMLAAVGVVASVWDPGIAWTYLPVPLVVLCCASWETVRSACYVHRQPWFSLLGNGIFALVQVAGTASAVVLDAGLGVVWLAWACGAGLASYIVGGILLRGQERPESTVNRFRVRYAVDSVMGSGAAQLSLAGGSLILGAGFVGSVRGASLLLGPVALVVAASRLVLVPRYARGPAPRLWFRTALAVAIAGLFWGLGFHLLLPELGGVLLGDTWPETRRVLLLVTCGFMAQTVFDTAFAYGRARHFDRACTRARLVVAVSAVLTLSSLFLDPRPVVFLTLMPLLTMIAATPILRAILGDCLDRDDTHRRRVSSPSPGDVQPSPPAGVPGAASGLSLQPESG